MSSGDLSVSSDSLGKFKCINSDQFYQVYMRFSASNRVSFVTVDILCDNDPSFYQACSVRSTLVNYLKHERYGAPSKSGHFPCGFLCIEDGAGARTDITLRNDGECGADNGCLNPVEIDQSSCPIKTGDLRCDMVCDSRDCEDESFCNGLSYGLWCDNHTTYTPPPLICDGYVHCKDEMDEIVCNIDTTTFNTCRLENYIEFDDNISIPLFNFTRCRPLTHYEQEYLGLVFHYCEDYLDQTNCTDKTRVGLYCPIQGFLSTVSKEVVCSTAKKYTSDLKARIPSICDDNLEKTCISASYSCNVHKHQLCDGQSDCQDNGDEKNFYCQHLTDQHCVRRFVHAGSRRNAKFPIPMDWVHDGVLDCLNGEDESESWPTCGRGRTLRYKDDFNSSCSEVFLCAGSEEFIVFSRLCDRAGSCGNENQICEKSRDQPATLQHAFRADINGVAILLYCHKGLRSILELKSESCVRQDFIHSERKIFGKNQSLSIWLPKTERDCGFFYGESYVFLSCSQMCRNSHCPLGSVKRINFDSCSGQFAKATVFSADDLGNLALLLRSPKTRFLSNDIFFCENNQKCLTLDKVCNLVDDCGDGSDEKLCDNHFQCEASKEYIPLNQKCDQVLHCQDFSDECNESCGKTIIGGSIGLKFMAWLIGILAIVLNLYALVKNLTDIITCRSEAAFITNGLIILISSGDFLVGLYLVLLAFFDAYHGSKHCEMQTEWLTSISCVSLGIVNFLGSEISLFSMTVLSAFRALGSVKNSFSVPKDRTGRSVAKLVSIVFFIFAICFVISFLPMLKFYEDYFMNGIRYESSNTLFIGCPGKERHLSILGKYFGRMSLSGQFSWSQINGMIASMFSNDYGGIQKQMLSFYGNHPVCVFKYFVRINDPQKYFSLVVLSVNCLCFVAITICYVAIACASNNSSKRLKANSENKTQNSAAETANARLQRVVHMMILTDFLCWIPFVITCWLHFLSVIDGSPWYPTFSILVLPINCVVNPLLYDKSITGTIDSIFVRLKTKIASINLLEKPKDLVIQGPAMELEERKDRENISSSK